ncbi:protein C3orf33-like [Argonauta hians]
MPLNLPEKFQIKKVDIHNFIDSHIIEIRNGVYGVAAVGVLLCLRSLRPFAKFSRPEDVPRNFIKKNVKLQGRVEKVGEEGKLMVDHEPIVRLPWHKDKPPLAIKLAFLEITPHSRLWLLKNVSDKHIWFRPIRISNGGMSLDCIAYTKGFLGWRVNINDKMVRTGNSKLQADIDVGSNPKLKKHLENLVKLEAQADRKGAGMWKRDPQLYSVQGLVHYVAWLSRGGWGFIQRKLSQIKQGYNKS